MQECDKLQDLEWTKELFAYGIDKDYAKCSPFLRGLFTRIAHRNLSILHECSESPIETLFFTTLLIGFARESLLPECIIAGRTPDIEANVWMHRQQFEAAYKEAALAADPALRGAFEYGLYHSFHIYLQPTIVDFYGKGKNIRADASIWIPSNPLCSVVVECDGYAYHNDKDSFAADRKRDRKLADRGYMVRRYSGTEIYTDPQGAAQDLFIFLTENFEFGARIRDKWAASLESNTVGAQ